MKPCIVGWSHSPFGKLDGVTMEGLLCDAAADAVADAGIEAHEIDEVFVGTFNPGFVDQDFPGALAINRLSGLRFRPATRVENACASGSAALYQAANAIASGRARIALVVGVEKMTGLGSADVGKALLKASYIPETAGLAGGFAGVFGNIATRYFDQFGDQSDALAAIAAKNHKNACANPLAHMRHDLGFDFCRTVSERNPFVAGPLRRTDCALISDGAAAVVLAGSDVAQAMKKAVRLRAMRQTSDYLPLLRRDDPCRLEGAERAWAAALEEAGVTTTFDLDFIELHDCFTISELLQYEALGITSRGKGASAILDGVTTMGGLLPVNPSGGLKAKGHPIGATGVAMHVHAAMQLTGHADGTQVNGASLGAVFNMGGVAVANYASILEPLR